MVGLNTRILAAKEEGRNGTEKATQNNVAKRGVIFLFL
jgi:hypothetical protein